ncbi:MAG: reverse transcriptase domain-containing protein, partial [bacterium]
MVQGPVLSPFLFNIYLDEPLNSNRKIGRIKARGDLLAFADDMLVLTNSKPEMAEVFRHLDGLQADWNLRMNKKKSQILTKDPKPDIEGVPCMQQVKYLEVPIHVDLLEQRKMAKTSIESNLYYLRW